MVQRFEGPVYQGNPDFSQKRTVSLGSIGDWGLGIGDCGLRIADCGLLITITVSGSSAVPLGSLDRRDCDGEQFVSFLHQGLECLQPDGAGLSQQFHPV